MFSFVTLLSLLGAIFALSYGWFAGIKYLATISFLCVSLALLLVFFSVLVTLVELHVLQFRNATFLPQFNKDWEKDLDDIIIRFND